MTVIILVYCASGVLVAVGALWWTSMLRKRRSNEKAPVPPDFQQTNEILLDPTTGKKQRVWYNPKTGERFYEIYP